MRLGLGHSDPVADPIALTDAVAEPVTDGDPDPAGLS